MRIFVLFALALTATVLLTDDASAIGKRNRGSSSCGGCGATTASYGGCGTTVASTTSCGGCGGAPAYMGAPGNMTRPTYPGRMGYAPNTVGGQAAVIQATDGQIYRLGADGSYYAGSGITTLGGFVGQPYTSGYYPGQNVYPASGTPPLTMPGATIPGTMPPK